MSVYSIRGKGWRYDFILKGIRYTSTWFKTKTEAKEAEAKRKEGIEKPKPEIQIPTDMAFLELVNRRLDYVKAYKSEKYYIDNVSLSKMWVKKWDGCSCGDIAKDEVQRYLYKRKKRMCLLD